jgi:hypothetical protein
METIALLLSGISTVAAVASAIAAFKARNEVKSLVNQIDSSQQRAIKTTGDVKTSNEGSNSGTIVGINSGNIK